MFPRCRPSRLLLGNEFFVSHMYLVPHRGWPHRNIATIYHASNVQGITDNCTNLKHQNFVRFLLEHLAERCACSQHYEFCDIVSRLEWTPFISVTDIWQMELPQRLLRYAAFRNPGRYQKKNRQVFWVNPPKNLAKTPAKNPTSNLVQFCFLCC